MATLDAPRIRPSHGLVRVMPLLLFALGGTALMGAQTPPASDSVAASGAASTAPSVAATRLSVTDTERQYFELGDVLAKAAFAYAQLTQQTRLISRAGMDDAQLTQIGKLAPDARTARGGARGLLSRAVTLLQGLKAPVKVVSPLAVLASQFAKPLAPTGTSKQIAAFAPDVGTVLAVLDESTHLSKLLDSRALQAWATGPGSSRAGRVWYAEGLMAGVADVASATGQADLLPPPSELATDLRGLRDWLSLRMPEAPTPDQAALQTAIDTFLQQTSAKGKRPGPLTAAQLEDLGDISHLLQAQILPDDAQVALPQNIPTQPDGGKGAPDETPPDSPRGGRA